MDFHLKELSPDDSVSVYNMLQRIGENEYGFHNDVHGMTLPEFREWLVLQQHWAQNQSLPVGYVQQWTYWLMFQNNPIGYGKLRKKVTEQSKQFGGNIGYAIDPLYRGKGFGKILFALLIQQAKYNKIKEIYSTVEKPNVISMKVHLDCGMHLINENDKRWYFYSLIE